MLNRHLLILVLLFAVCLAVPPAFAQDGTPSSEEYTKDATGAEVTLWQDAQRIVTLAPNVTEMVCYLGFGDRLVGCSSFCDYPPEVVSDLPRIGGFVDTSLEAIVALDPDLVIAYQGNSRELVDQLRELDITVLAFSEATSLRDVAGQLYDLSNVVSQQTFENNPAADDFNSRRLALEKPGLDRTSPVKVFFGYPGEMSYTCGPGSFLNDLIQRAGCRNVVTDTSERWPMVGAEFIIASDPDVILTATGCTGEEDPAEVRAKLLTTLQADPVWSELDAVKRGRIIVIDSDILMRPGPRLLDALLEFDTQLKALGFTGIPGEATPE